MKLYPITLEFNSYDTFTCEKGIFVEINLIHVVYKKWREKQFIGFFYNDGTIIVTLIFKEFVLRWNHE